uniref:8.9 kDa family member n=1 Tax=Rhipicephalus zambeziensis TaxID=60191 RepID=A0A224Y1A1_9ACAR
MKLAALMVLTMVYTTLSLVSASIFVPVETVENNGTLQCQFFNATISNGSIKLFEKPCISISCHANSGEVELDGCRPTMNPWLYSSGNYYPKCCSKNATRDTPTNSE